MYFFGHMGVVLFLGFMLSLPIAYLFLGSMLPDMIDKPLFLLGIAPSGRYISHTLIFVATSSIATYLITRKKSAALALSFGVFLHILLDSMYAVPWFYPFVDYEFEPYIIELKLDPILISAEIIGFILIFAIVKYGPALDTMRKKLKLKSDKLKK